MNLTPKEASFLREIAPQLKENPNQQAIINALRVVSQHTFQQGQYQGKSGYSVDQNWSDADLKGKK